MDNEAHPNAIAYRRAAEAFRAGDLDTAIALLRDCPMDMWVYEAMPM